MKKFLAIILSLCIVASCLAACGETAQSPSNTTSDNQDINSHNSEPQETESSESGELILSVDGVEISFLGFSEPPAPALGYYINLHIENTSDVDYTIQVEDISVDNIMVPFGSYIFSSKVLAGKKLNDKIWVINLDQLGITTPLTSAEFKFVLFENGDYMSGVYSEVISVGE